MSCYGNWKDRVFQEEYRRSALLNTVRILGGLRLVGKLEGHCCSSWPTIPQKVFTPLPQDFYNRNSEMNSPGRFIDQCPIAIRVFLTWGQTPIKSITRGQKLNFSFLGHCNSSLSGALILDFLNFIRYSTLFNIIPYNTAQNWSNIFQDYLSWSIMSLNVHAFWCGIFGIFIPIPPSGVKISVPMQYYLQE